MLHKVETECLVLLQKAIASKLDDFFTKKQKVPSRNKPGSVPTDYDVILPGMGYTKPTKNKQPKKIKKK